MYEVDRRYLLSALGSLTAAGVLPWRASAAEVRPRNLIEAPRFQASVTVDYKRQLTQDWDGHFSLTATGRSKVYSQPAGNDPPFQDERYKEEGFTSLGTRISATRIDNGLELALFVRNLTDERHSDAASPVSAGYLFKALNEPRTVGFELTLRR